MSEVPVAEPLAAAPPGQNESIDQTSPDATFEDAGAAPAAAAATPIGAHPVVRDVGSVEPTELVEKLRGVADLLRGTPSPARRGFFSSFGHGEEDGGKEQTSETPVVPPAAAPPADHNEGPGVCPPAAAEAARPARGWTTPKMRGGASPPTARSARESRSARGTGTGTTPAIRGFFTSRTPRRRGDEDGGKVLGRKSPISKPTVV